MWYIYILKSEKYTKSYVGCSNNPERRLREHNSGKTYFTKRYMPWRVIYTEEYETPEEARKRERYLKSASGRKRVLKQLFNN